MVQDKSVASCATLVAFRRVQRWPPCGRSIHGCEGRWRRVRRSASSVGHLKGSASLSVLNRRVEREHSGSQQLSA